MTPTLVLATNNAHKVEELSALLAREHFAAQVRSARGFGGMPPVEETETSFAGNARLKATGLLAALRERGQPLPWLVLADDSGIAVDALGGAPGVYSARYAGESASDAENNARLLRELAEVPEAERTGRFVCALAGIFPESGTELRVEGTVEGRIAFEPTGGHGFGYDPLFVPEGHTRTFGELGAEVKHGISHRARAVAALARRLQAAE